MILARASGVGGRAKGDAATRRNELLHHCLYSSVGNAQPLPGPLALINMLPMELLFDRIEVVVRSHPAAEFHAHVAFLQRDIRPASSCMRSSVPNSLR